MKKILFLTSIFTILAITIASAQLQSGNVETSCTVLLSGNGFKNLTEIIHWVICMAGLILPFGLTLAFIIFMWNVIQYVIRPNPTKLDERKKYIWWAMIGLFVLVAVWGLVSFVTTTLGLGFVVPQLPVK
jgi:hypothetical protein